MSRRTSRVAATIQRSLQTLLAKGLSDPRVRGLVTVTDVAVSEDLTRATIRISVLPEEHEALTLHGIRSASKYLRRRVGDMMEIKKLPEFHFELDRALKRQTGVLEALDRVRADLGEEPERELKEGSETEETPGAETPAAEEQDA